MGWDWRVSHLFFHGAEIKVDVRQHIDGAQWREFEQLPLEFAPEGCFDDHEEEDGDARPDFWDEQVVTEGHGAARARVADAFKRFAARALGVPAKNCPLELKIFHSHSCEGGDDEDDDDSYTSSRFASYIVARSTVSTKSLSKWDQVGSFGWGITTELFDPDVRDQDRDALRRILHILEPKLLSISTPKWCDLAVEQSGKIDRQTLRRSDPRTRPGITSRKQGISLETIFAPASRILERGRATLQVI